MNKTTIELERQTHYPGWGCVCEQYRDENSPLVMEGLLDWGRRPENLTKKVYRHYLRRAEENRRKATKTELKKAGKTSQGYVVEERCDLVQYLDIYWQ